MPRSRSPPPIIFNIYLQENVSFNMNYNIVKRGVAYPKAGFTGGVVWSSKRKRFSECPATLPTRRGLYARLVHISEKCQDRGKCLERNPGSDFLSATNFDSGKENPSLTLSHWRSYRRSLGPRLSIYLSSLTRWLDSAALRRVARVPPAEALSLSNWISLEGSTFPSAFFYYIIFFVENIW